MTTRLCVLDHHGHDTPAESGIDLCTGHLEDLQQDLNDTDLLLHLIWDMTLPTRGDGNRRGKPIDASAPANLAAICATDWRTHPDHGDQLVSVVAVIQKWGARIWRRLPLETPTHPTIGWAQDLIREHLDWLLRAPNATEFATDMHDTAHMLRTCAGEILPPIGRHRAPHPRHPERDCGGRLYPSATSTHDNPGVVCIDCGETYQGAREVRRLGLLIGAAR
jgi:hypothetical protein